MAEGGAGACVVRHGPPKDSGPAHHERGRANSTGRLFGGLRAGMTPGWRRGGCAEEAG